MHENGNEEQQPTANLRNGVVGRGATIEQLLTASVFCVVDTLACKATNRGQIDPSDHEPSRK